MWTLYLFQENSTERKKHAEFTNIVEAFRAGNRLIKQQACKRYRVEETEGEAIEAQMFNM